MHNISNSAVMQAPKAAFSLRPPYRPGLRVYAEKLEMLSIDFVGDSDEGMVYALNGCKNLRKLEIRDSPFGDAAVLEDMNQCDPFGCPRVMLP